MAKTHILIQARLSSSRFPRKMVEKIGELTLCEYVYKRCMTSKKAGFVAVITSDEPSDDELVSLCQQRHIPVFRGSLNDVLGRYIEAAEEFGSENIVRVCGDSPFVDTDFIDKLIQLAIDDKLDYCATVNCLNGFRSEVVRLSALKHTYMQDDLGLDDMEHVTKYMVDRLDSFKTLLVNTNLKSDEVANYTLTVDFPDDIETIRQIAKNLNNFAFSSDEIIKHIGLLKRTDILR
jgi:spore coat polysaccharide biosynthesis protein SpsF (cytidylyltransferase family)